jgi:hypothetical protein
LPAELYWRCTEEIDYRGLPETARQTMRNYVERGFAPGDGMLLVLENSLSALFRFHDMDALVMVARWVHNTLPAPLWGSKSRVRSWMALAADQFRQRA